MKALLLSLILVATGLTGYTVSSDISCDTTVEMTPLRIPGGTEDDN